ncbi:MAG: P-II family nitrogen regulator [Bacteroidetes bacterium]|nr:P-II family nitrogen regulator [Bacteroidota bacterium]
MKKIEAIVRLSRFDRIRDALAQIGVNFFTLKEVKGFGLQKGEKLVYRGSIYDSDYIPRLQLDILTRDDKVDLIMDTILKAGRSGEVGDGKIALFNVEKVIRIRNGAINEEAIEK